jgi:hypothetical protein
MALIDNLEEKSARFMREYERLKPRMSRAEQEAILDGPFIRAQDAMGRAQRRRLSAKMHTDMVEADAALNEALEALAPLGQLVAREETTE